VGYTFGDAVGDIEGGTGGLTIGLSQSVLSVGLSEGAVVG